MFMILQIFILCIINKTILNEKHINKSSAKHYEQRISKNGVKMNLGQVLESHVS